MGLGEVVAMVLQLRKHWRSDAFVIRVLFLLFVLALELVWLAGSNLGWGPTMGTTVLIVALATFLALTLLLRDRREPLLERVSKFAGIIAFTAAGGYFAFQLASGQLSSDLSVIVDAERTRTGDHDSIVLKVTLKHERHASLRLLDAVAYVRRLDTNTSSSKPLLDGYYRRALVNGHIANAQDNAGGRPKRPVLNAGDEVQLAHVIPVGRYDAVVIDVVIVAGLNIGYLNSEQWISSVASAPIAEDDSNGNTTTLGAN